MTQPTKDELIKAREILDNSQKYHDGSFYIAIRTAIEALGAQIKACDAPKIEGLGEALKDFDENGSALMDYENTDVLAEAARAYHKLTGGE